MKKTKRILALIGAILLIALYIITIILAFINTEEAHTWFMASLYTTIVLPVIIYGYTLIHKVVSGKKNRRND